MRSFFVLESSLVKLYYLLFYIITSRDIYAEEAAAALAPALATADFFV